MELRYYQKEAVQAMLEAKSNEVVVMPTGSGKTIVIAEFLKQYKGKVLVLSHVKEILAQNYESLVKHGVKEVGLWSAGLGIKIIKHVTVAGIQSVYNKPELFSEVDLLLIDECHLVNHENAGMYRRLVHDLGRPVLGLTATPFRLKHGYIWNGEDSLFTGPCYDLTAHIPKLVKERYLCNLVSRAPEHRMDVSGIRVVAGEFSEQDMDDKLVQAEATEEILTDLLKYDYGYYHWLLFAINIRHATMIQRSLIAKGIRTGIVHSNMADWERDKAVQRFKDGDLTAIVNVGVLTIGFDSPHIDLIALLRPTKSPSLYAQMVGRGLRVAPGKDHCLVLDFAGNIPRLGTIDELNIDDKGKVKQLGGIGAPVRECPKCHLYIPIRLTVCSGCGYTFPEKVKLQLVASEGQLIGGNKSKPKWYNVDRVIANVHRKKGSPPSVKLSYVCGIRVFAEWLCIEHPHQVGEIGRRKLLNRWAEADPPTTAAEVCKHQRLFKVPKRIEVSEAGQHPAILTREY